jgi:hypothetical protein
MMPTFQELIDMYSDRIELNQAEFMHDLVTRHQALANSILHNDYPKAG